MTRRQLTEFSMFLPKTGDRPATPSDRLSAMMNLEYRRKIGGITKEQYLAEIKAIGKLT